MPRRTPPDLAMERLIDEARLLYNDTCLLKVNGSPNPRSYGLALYLRDGLIPDIRRLGKDKLGAVSVRKLNVLERRVLVDIKEHSNIPF